ncbi:hypothetical protein FGX02_00300, partial [Xylella fastidiosa subsp. multiplex]|nr:hypothetical protein [Xylella fastidiosa subsp. multiplex]
RDRHAGIGGHALAAGAQRERGPPHVVPISRLSEAVLAARADVEELGLTAPMCGHVGDGNFHLCVVVDPADADEMARAK